MAIAEINTGQKKLWLGLPYLHLLWIYVAKRELAAADRLATAPTSASNGVTVIPLPTHSDIDAGESLTLLCDSTRRCYKFIRGSYMYTVHSYHHLLANARTSDRVG